MPAKIEIINDDGVTVISDTRNVIALLRVGGTTPPDGTLFSAVGPGDTVYWFGRPQTPSSWGFQIFDEAGELLFDAVNYAKLTKPVGVIDGVLDITQLSVSVTKTFPVPSGRTYAVWLHHPPSAFRVRNVATGSGGSTTYQYALDQQYTDITFSGSQITLAARREEGPLAGGSAVPYTEGGFDPLFRAVVLDVTGF